MAESIDYITEIAGDEDLRAKIHKRYKYASAFYSDWIVEAKGDYDFALGDQWTQEDLEVLKEQARPAMTFNRIKGIINLISGYQRENSTRLKVNPEGGEDRIFSEVMDRIIKAVDKWSHLNYKMGYWFDDGCYCGKGWLEAIISYDKDPIRGELQFKQRSPYQILPDPDCNEYDLNEGHRYCIKVVKLTKAELRVLYPKKKKIIENLIKDSVEDDPTESIPAGVILKEGSDDDYGNRSNITTVVQTSSDDEQEPLDEDIKYTIKEHWEAKPVDRFFVIDMESGEPRKFKKKDEAESFVAQQGFGKVIERQVNEMHVSALCAGWLLQEEELSPFEPYYSGYPFFRFLADWAPNANEEVQAVQGITRQLKDPQREKNKAKSQNLHILNTQANSGWIGDEDALTPEGWKKLEQLGSKPGLVVKTSSGKSGALREILPKDPNAGMIQREEKADEEFYRISTINPDLLGFREGDLSGRAMGIRVRQGLVALARLFFNYRYSKEILGRFILRMVPLLFDVKKVMKVLGPQYMRKALDPERYPQGLSEGHISAFLQMVEDEKYDVFVSEAGENATIRYEILGQLTELLKAGAPIPIDLVIDYLDLPNSEEVKQKVQQQQQMMLAAQTAQGKRAP